MGSVYFLKSVLCLVGSVEAGLFETWAEHHVDYLRLQEKWGGIIEEALSLVLQGDWSDPEHSKMPA